MKYILTALAFSISMALGNRSSLAQVGMLVTPDEAKSAAVESPYPKPRAVLLPDAPRIVFASPDLNAAITVPARIEIRFVSAESAEIVPDSFRVFYGARRWDITDRLLRVGSISKFGLTAASVSLPPGEHQVAFSITDSLGRQSLQNFKITVR